MKFKPLIPAVLVRRDNRFRVQVRLRGETVPAHLPNSGRLGELLTPGRRVWLAPAAPERVPHRRTAYDLALVAHAGRLVSVDARLPPHLVAEALRQGRLTALGGYTDVQQEVRLGASRLDLRLTAGPGQPPCWMEVKSVTLVEDETALFPDAPTTRGQRHLRELIAAVERGERAAILFVIQRDDARRFAPHDQADPIFGKILRQAAQAGVEVHAWRCQVSLSEIRLSAPLPVMLHDTGNPSVTSGPGDNERNAQPRQKAMRPQKSFTCQLDPPTHLW